MTDEDFSWKTWKYAFMCCFVFGAVGGAHILLWAACWVLWFHCLKKELSG